MGQVLVNRNDDKWVIVLSGHDMYVVDKTGDKKKRLLVTSYFNNGQIEQYTRMNDVHCIAEDNDGAIWLGTSKGVAVYNNPGRIWDTDNFYAIQPSLDLNDDFTTRCSKTKSLQPLQLTVLTVNGWVPKILVFIWFLNQEPGKFYILLPVTARFFLIILFQSVLTKKRGGFFWYRKRDDFIYG
jgi:hypothetical protein